VVSRGRRLPSGGGLPPRRDITAMKPSKKWLGCKPKYVPEKIKIMGTGGKDGKFCLFFSHYGGIAVTRVYLCIIR
jgi:hypothetical protein